MASYPVLPDALFCSAFLGGPLSKQSCQATVDNLPQGTLPTIFTTRAHTATNNYVQVPARYGDIELGYSCTITIDLDGHSRTDQYVLVPWDEVRKMAQAVVDGCVDGLHRGGYITYGIGRVFESLLDPTAYEGGHTEIPPAWVQQPDGTVDTVAIPPTRAENEYNIPYYMTVTVSGPSVIFHPEQTDYGISLRVMEAAQRRFGSARTRFTQDKLVRILKGLSRNLNSLRSGDHPRWWEYPEEPPTPIPINVKYACDKTLGSPSIGNCEAALFRFVRRGNVVLDPMSRPIIKVTGNCAIAVRTNEKHTTTWDMLRSVAETLIGTCVSSSGSGTLGGTAISQTVRSQRRSQDLGRRQSETLRVAFPPTFQIAVYLQPPFNGLADTTCSWGVVASHQGDVRQCPTNFVPDRPPERELGANATLAGNSTGQTISTLPLINVTNLTGTAAFD